MAVLVTWTETTILVNGIPTRRSSLRNEISSIRHSDDESYGVRITVFSSAIVIDVIVHCHTQGPVESKCRKQLSLSSCGWVLIRSGQFKITYCINGIIESMVYDN